MRSHAQFELERRAVLRHLEHKRRKEKEERMEARIEDLEARLHAIECGDVTVPLSKPRQHPAVRGELFTKDNPPTGDNR